MTYQARAPKKAYFAAGFEAGFKAALERVDNPICDRCSCGEYVYISWNEPQCDEQDIDDAWCDYCDYWKAKAMEGKL